MYPPHFINSLSLLFLLYWNGSLSKVNGILEITKKIRSRLLWLTFCVKILNIYIFYLFKLPSLVQSCPVCFYTYIKVCELERSKFDSIARELLTSAILRQSIIHPTCHLGLSPELDAVSAASGKSDNTNQFYL